MNSSKQDGMDRGCDRAGIIGGKESTVDLARCNNAARCGEYNVVMKSARE